MMYRYGRTQSKSANAYVRIESALPKNNTKPALCVRDDYGPNVNPTNTPKVGRDTLNKQALFAVESTPFSNNISTFPDHCMDSLSSSGFDSMRSSTNSANQDSPTKIHLKSKPTESRLSQIKAQLPMSDFTEIGNTRATETVPTPSLAATVESTKTERNTTIPENKDTMADESRLQKLHETQLIKRQRSESKEHKRQQGRLFGVFRQLSINLAFTTSFS